MSAVCSVHDQARQVIVEYGPGNGAITKGLLKPGVLSEDSRLIVIERNKRLAASLAKKIASDPRTSVFHKDAQEVESIMNTCNEPHADAVISGIPFSMLPPEAAKSIVEQTHRLLRPGGVFVVYQVKDTVRQYLQQYFDDLHEEKIRRTLVRLYVARKKDDTNGEFVA